MQTPLNYYDELIDEIKKLISNYDYNGAFVKINDELMMPYIPQQVETVLRRLLQEVNEKMQKQKPRETTVWTLAKISDILANPADEETQLLAFQYLKDQNLRQILPVIRKYFLNKKVTDFAKIYLLYLLKKQEITEIFEVKKTNGTFQLNPSQIIPYKENEQVKTIMKLLDQWVYNDNPSLYHTCLYLLETYYYNLYPYFLENNEEKELTVAIIYQGHRMYGEQIVVQDLVEQFKVQIEIVKKYLPYLEQEGL
ncbi:DUF3196 domain-containing protein [Spiroplasma sp. ChiS]|uniref:DUF3196 family protein n=1 Tax=Spiroplasma sp. ChiS TaxID=2099885 RepID=UPI000CF9EF80|nr:DUF3196 family protein [Spiroplasma sp. ChiS]PQP78542.1 DUF3196 domain-containing protein [Spiroplasma sp. ChiS]